MSASVFVDTNVLVYARDASEPAKQPAALAWLTELWQRGEGQTSVQVLNEYFVTVTQKLSPGLSRKEARADVEALFAWSPIALDTGLVTSAWSVQERYGFSWWNALVVARRSAARWVRLPADRRPTGRAGAGCAKGRQSVYVGARGAARRGATVIAGSRDSGWGLSS